MKTSIKLIFILFFSLFMGIESFAQSQPSDRVPLADKSTIKGRKELRKEKKIRRRTERHTKRVERKAIKASKATKYTVGKAKKPRLKKKGKEKGSTEPKDKS
jgi:hypothetical protein